jgi:hypothetical protein
MQPDIAYYLDEMPRLTPVASTIGGLVILYGYAIKESTGNTGAEVDLYDGTDATSGTFLPLPLEPGQAVIDWFGPKGIWFRNGLFPSVPTGAVSGALFVTVPIQRHYGTLLNATVDQPQWRPVGTIDE